MNRTNVRTLLVKATGILSVTSLSVLIGLPGFSQQSPANTSQDVPSTVKPTNPGGRDAGTTNGGEDLNRVPSSSSTTQQNNDRTGGQNGAAPTNPDPSTNPPNADRVEGRDQSNPNRVNTSPDSSNQPSVNQPGANQPGATTGGNSSQQVEQNQGNGSTTQQNQTAPQGSYQSSPQPSTQSDTNSGSSTSGDTSQQQPSNGGVRALW
ncbi:MAG: hypothetical protein KME45_11880 [Stenomitos rutilans HA7619-LM2]|jgi:hypothetical protein|nr:hypothetical protein [Stenomitos rutilans HA7619-LM2]